MVNSVNGEFVSNGNAKRDGGTPWYDVVFLNVRLNVEPIRSGVPGIVNDEDEKVVNFSVAVIEVLFVNDNRKRLALVGDSEVVCCLCLKLHLTVFKRPVRRREVEHDGVCSVL